MAMTPQDAIWKVLAQIQAQSANEPQPDFRVEAELPSANAIMADAAARDPFRMDKLVSLEKPSQPKVDWKMAAMLAEDSRRRIAMLPSPTIGATSGGQALPSERPNPLAGIPMQVQRDNPLAGIAMPGVQREPISMGWRTPQAMADRATAGAREQFDVETPLTNTAIRMAGPMLGGAIGAVGGPVGMAAGAAMGGTLASEWAQSRETAQGTRAGVNPLVMAAEGYANLLPVMMPEAGAALAPQLPKVLGSALGGAAVSDAAIQMAETGRIDPSKLVENTLVGGVVGGGAAMGAHALSRGAQSDAVARLVDDETGAVGPRPIVSPEDAIAKAKTLYVERGAGQSPVRMAQALRDSGYTDAPHDLVARLVSEVEGTPLAPRPAPTRVRRQAQPRHNPFHVALESKLHNVDGEWVWGKVDAATGRVVPDAAPAVAPTGAAVGGRAGALARLFSDETGAVGPNIREALPQQPDAAPGGRLEMTPAPLPEAPDVPATEGVTRFKKLPASERGVLDRVPVPESMAPSGLTEAERRADKIRIGKAIRRSDSGDEGVKLIEGIFEGGRDYNFEQHRRMRTTWEQSRAEASRIVPEPALPKGSILNTEDSIALKNMAHGVASQTVDTANDYAQGVRLSALAANGDEAARAQLDEILAQHRVKSLPELKLARKESYLKTQVAFKSLSGSKSETGRALNSFKMHVKAREMNDADFLERAIGAGADGDDALDALANMKDSNGRIDREAQFRYLRGLTKPGAQDYWHWYARTAYLSSMATQWRNLSGNLSNFGLEALAVRPVAAAIDSKNTVRSVTLPEMRAMGTTSGFLDGLHKASFFFKNGFTKEDVDALESLPPEVFDGKLFPNVIARTMGAVDQFFRTVGFHVELHRMAITEAHQQGLRGDAMLARAKELVDDPTITPDLVKRAERYAAGLTFQDKGTAATRAAHQSMKWVDSLTSGLADKAWEAGLSKYGKAGSATYGLLSFPPSVIIAPFINTPFNILKRAGQYTPAGMIASKFVKDPRDSAMMAARGAVGTAMMGAAVGLWYQGRMTGKPPQYGTPEWEEFYATKKPYSIKIGNQWVPYSYLGPVGMVLGATANYAEAASRDPYNAVGHFGRLFTITGRTALDASFLRGMQSILMATADETPEQRYAQKFINSTVTGLLPLAGAQRDVRNLIDPTLRDPVTSTDMKGAPQTWGDQFTASFAPLKEQVMSAVPGLSQKLEPRLDRTGQEIQRGSTVLPESKPDDPVRAELRRLHGETEGGYYRDPVNAGQRLLTKINTKVKAKNREDNKDRPLLASVPRPLITAYAKRFGQLSEERMTWLINKSWYQEADDDQKRRWVDKVKRDTAEKVDREFMDRYIKQATFQR